jgi:hypothetical protein
LQRFLKDVDHWAQDQSPAKQQVVVEEDPVTPDELKMVRVL